MSMAWKSVRLEYETTLVCGHTTRTRGQVYNKKATFACPNTPRCGYSVRWASWLHLPTKRSQDNDDV